MPSVASPLGSQAAVSSEISLTSKRDSPVPRVETMNIDEAAKRGYFRKGKNAEISAEHAAPDGTSAPEKRQWTSEWNCQYNSGGMYISSFLYINANSHRW